VVCGRSLLRRQRAGIDLGQIVDETIELYRKDGKPLPKPTAGRDLVNRLQNVA
jgi:hypothetical protein